MGSDGLKHFRGQILDRLRRCQSLCCSGILPFHMYLLRRVVPGVFVYNKAAADRFGATPYWRSTRGYVRYMRRLQGLSSIVPALHEYIRTQPKVASINSIATIVVAIQHSSFRDVLLLSCLRAVLIASSTHHPAHKLAKRFVAA